MNVILDAFKDSAHVFAEGFKVNGEKFTVINATDRSLWAKKVVMNLFTLLYFNRLTLGKRTGQNGHDHC
jgi:hypothetical protein